MLNRKHLVTAFPVILVTRNRPVDFATASFMSSYSQSSENSLPRIHKTMTLQRGGKGRVVL